MVQFISYNLTLKTYTGSPGSIGVCWDLDFIKECMKTNTVRSTLRFLKIFKIKINRLLYEFCVLQSFLES